MLAEALLEGSRVRMERRGPSRMRTEYLTNHFSHEGGGRCYDDI